MKIYLVGGAVRDMLLGLPVHERDWVVVGATPEQMLTLGYKPVGKDFPVFLHPDTREEYALARTERKTAPGYRGFTFHADPDVTLEQDLHRRDLTINAIVQDDNGQLIDPCGGQHDLQQKILRHVSPAFAEDPVRILRVARFASRFHHFGFHIAEETLALMQSMVKHGEANALVAERVWQECERALGEKNPHIFFDVLYQCGALTVIFSEIDFANHALPALQQCAALTNEKTARFAALCHKLEKSALLSMCQRLSVPNEYRDLALCVIMHHEQYVRALELPAESIVALFENMDLFRRPQRLEPFLMACEAYARTLDEFDKHQTSIFLLNTFSVCSAVDSNSVDSQRFKGKVFGEELRRLRIAAVNTIEKSGQQNS